MNNQRNIMENRQDRVSNLLRANFRKHDPRRQRRIGYIEKKMLAVRNEMLRREQAADAAHKARVEYAARNYLSIE